MGISSLLIAQSLFGTVEYVAPKELSIEEKLNSKVLIEIAKCESGFVHYLETGEVITGRIDPDDTGLLQINKRIHKKELEQLGLDPFNLDDNIAFGHLLYFRDGTTPWNASKACWGDKI